MGKGGKKRIIRMTLDGVGATMPRMAGGAMMQADTIRGVYATIERGTKLIRGKSNRSLDRQNDRALQILRLAGLIWFCRDTGRWLSCHGYVVADQAHVDLSPPPCIQPTDQNIAELEAIEGLPGEKR